MLCTSLKEIANYLGAIIQNTDMRLSTLYYPRCTIHAVLSTLYYPRCTIHAVLSIYTVAIN